MLRLWKQLGIEVAEVFQAAKDMQGAGDPRLIGQRVERISDVESEVSEELRKLRLIEDVMGQYQLGQIHAERAMSLIQATLSVTLPVVP